MFYEAGLSPPHRLYEKDRGVGYYKRNGFTLIEIIIVVVILGVLASLAIPRVTASSEFSVSSEGRQILIILLGGQTRYKLENGAYSTDATLLDVSYPAPHYFAAATAANNVNAVASITRAGLYT